MVIIERVTFTRVEPARLMSGTIWDFFTEFNVEEGGGGGDEDGKGVDDEEEVDEEIEEGKFDGFVVSLEMLRFSSEF